VGAAAPGPGGGIGRAQACREAHGQEAGSQ
jgi:hypothetical protein